MNIKKELIDQNSADVLAGEEEKFYQDVRRILKQAREQAYGTASAIMTRAYWNVGKRIVEQEQKGKTKSKYGSYLLKNLSKELLDEFGTGFSVANLRNCRQFYLVFPQDSYGFNMAGRIPWSHLRDIMRISDEVERNFYLNEVANENWSVKTFFIFI